MPRRRGRALRRRYGHAGAGPIRTAARKIERMIADVEAGHTEGSADDAKVFNAINKLEDRVYKNWRASGDDAVRAEEDALVSSLRTRMRAAVPTGFEARQARRHGEIRAITERERDRIANMTPSQRAHYQYEQELKLTRGR
jgi:hypothetical protein